MQQLHAVGEGCPDLLVGFRGANYLIEVKDGAKPPSARRLNDRQKEWHEAWRGGVFVVASTEEALAVIGARIMK
ncbi:MAG: hypothetical protein LPK88_07030 [Alphaproteobacteria bacterium]|nr:hypothetical protein [Alphaproteobacteria bacterium]